ncbi:MAG: DJ-1 family glyoxalase III [Clostridium sp.]
MKRVAVLMSNGFEEIEALTVVDVLRRGNIHCDMVSIENNEYVTGSHDICVKANRGFGDDLKEYDLIVLPGGMPGARNLKNNSQVIELVKYFNDNKKYIGAICAAPIVLGEAGVVKNKKVTSYPGFQEEIGECDYVIEKVVVDENIITSRGPATTLEFSYKLMECLGSSEVLKIRNGMLYDSLF